MTIVLFFPVICRSYRSQLGASSDYTANPKYIQVYNIISVSEQPVVTTYSYKL